MGAKNYMFGVKLSNSTKEKLRGIALARTKTKSQRPSTLVIITDTITNMTVQYSSLRQANVG
jgi:hypothetical protein